MVDCPLEIEPRQTTTKAVLLSWVLRFCSCAHCGGSLANGFDDDHIKPLSMGGDNSVLNRQPLRKECHKKKTKSEVAARVKADSQGGRRGSQYGRRANRNEPLIQGRNEWPKSQKLPSKNKAYTSSVKVID